jgi:hypothetical protein
VTQLICNPHALCSDTPKELFHFLMKSSRLMLHSSIFLQMKWDPMSSLFISKHVGIHTMPKHHSIFKHPMAPLSKYYIYFICNCSNTKCWYISAKANQSVTANSYVTDLLSSKCASLSEETSHVKWKIICYLVLTCLMSTHALAPSVKVNFKPAKGPVSFGTSHTA